MRVVACVIMLTGSCLPVVSSATNFGRIEVTQPLCSRTYQGAFEPGVVQYGEWFGEPRAGVEIGYTCSFGPLAARDTVVDANGAHCAGLSIRVEEIARERWKRARETDSSRAGSWRDQYYVDTIDVVLDVQSYADRVAGGRAPDMKTPFAQRFPLLACTIECILDNAARSTPGIRFVRLGIIGPDYLHGLGGVYRVRAARPGVFGDPWVFACPDWD